MAFRLKKSESLENAVRRIAVEQIKKGLRELDDPKRCGSTLVHQIRKRCKKLRGLIRLVRPGFEETYRQENMAYRDLARELSLARDAQTALTAYERLLDWGGQSVVAEDFSRIHERLVEQLGSRSMGVPNEQTMALVRETLQSAVERAARWKLSGEESEVVLGGFQQTYARARETLRHAQDRPTSEALHQWRKWVKYHWYHVRLLQKISPRRMKRRRKVVYHLAEQLGEDHDLSVLGAYVLKDPADPGREQDVRIILQLIDKRQQQIRSLGFRTGEELFASRPKKFMKPIRKAWLAWR